MSHTNSMQPGMKRQKDKVSNSEILEHEECSVFPAAWFPLDKS